MPVWQETPRKEAARLKTRLRKMTTRKMEKLKTIKKIIYTSGSYNLHAKHNKAMAHISYMGLQQEKIQDIQDFRDQ